MTGLELIEAGFEVAITHPGPGGFGVMGGVDLPTPRCCPTVFSRSPSRQNGDSGRMQYAGACLGCGWGQGPFDTENEATEAAHDHAFPGWRELPIVDEPRFTSSPAQLAKRRRRLADELTPAYPQDWLDSGFAPMRTRRTTHATRHAPGASVLGTWGYNMCGEVVADLHDS